MNLKKMIIHPRFIDCDSMGHVNNAVYLTYIEEARIFFFNQLLPQNWDWKKNGVIIKKHEIVYSEQTFFGDIIEIETNILNIHKTSFEILHTLKVKNSIHCNVNTTLVYFDYNFNKIKNLDFEILKYLKSC